ncbi:sensor histidine kinase-like protein/response regulator [Lindgomyces ingoldianus]|uniref:Sensor histidine kinase-like protein/response regulator n=1 Tax=Lindgomyces ingoldianus TaxID=673940 RepID=A0ACB6R7T8_9PLEO|nr:sensor histidine kinase-like protein/response regulator [Lindgomyces ingoldianus]KAF2474805.1 sensor histidine kinase-like protein/response regulator [Lindgomyces ingoldianus]
MGENTVDPGSEPPDIIERDSLCFSRPQPGMVVHGGEDGFKEDLLRLYSLEESNAAEELVKLKDALRKTESESFWPLLTEGLANIADAQYAFVSKRILVDDEDVAVEMPPIGEPGACLMGAAFYFNDGHGVKHQLRNFKYHAYSCPCAYMRHDKIFIIPEKLNEFIVNNPNQLAVPGEAYIGIPLFAEGKCFAHFGVMWTKEGAARRKLGWGSLELLFHGLEDLILERVLERKEFAKSAEPAHNVRPRVIPHEAISVAQSLRPYARSLSHELRTPMQGVVGMLDVMMANVKEAAEGQKDPQIREVLDTLKENIEAVQDSSRRAVEAADNVVHAYDMNMGVPETPLSPLDKGPANNPAHNPRPDILVAGHTIPITQFRAKKRRREEVPWDSENTTKSARSSRLKYRHSFSEEPRARTHVHLSTSGTSFDTFDKQCSHGASETHCDSDTFSSPLFASEHSVVPGLRHTNLRDVLQYVINDALKVGGRPDSATAQETELGEVIEVRTRCSNGLVNTKMIEWMVVPDVPETILIDEKDLAKMISCVVLNAIKFTDNGSITLKACLSTKARYIVINVRDSGSGIPAAFLPNLFKPFSREDDSTTRQSEGLGLGLMVAKGLARKLGGDLFCLRSNVSGPEKGSEFEIRVPLTPGEVCSRPTSPFGSPTPSTKSRLSLEADASPLHGTPQPTTPPQVSEQPKNNTRKALARKSPSITFKPAPSLQHLGLPSPRRTASPARPRAASKSRTLAESGTFDRELAKRCPLNFLVVEDNKINRRLLKNMLQKLGYTSIVEAYDGNDAIDKMRKDRPGHEIDVVLMDLWMPLLDGFQATEIILKMNRPSNPTILAVSADITHGAFERAAKVGMKGFLTKPFQIRDLEKLILQYCASRNPSISEESTGL